MSALTPTPALLTPHLPPKTLVGIDLITFTSTSNFHGIRDLPAGWHFLYTGTTQGLSLRVGAWFYIGESAAGNAQDILVWRWNDSIEVLEPLGGHQAGEGMRLRANIGGVWGSGGLWAYRSRVPAAAVATAEGALQKNGSGSGSGTAGTGVASVDEEEEEDGRREWTALTNRLSSRLLSRVTGEPGVDWEGRPRWVVTSGSTAKQDDDDIPGLDSSAQPEGGGVSDTAAAAAATESQSQQRPEDYGERQFSFLPVDLKMTWREGAIGRERTEAARDKSWALGEIIHGFETSQLRPDPLATDDIAEGEAQILGELQFTFLMGLTLMNYSCLQQWKRLLRLILTCRSAIVDRASFIAEVLSLLLTQLQRADDVEGGLFDQLGSEGGAEGADFLRKMLKGFRTAMNEVLEDESGMSPVTREFARLEEWVREEYDWELDRDAVLRKGMVQLEDGEEVELEMVDHDDEEEYAPVVVNLDWTY